MLLYNDKTAVDVPDCKMMKIRLGQNFMIGTAPHLSISVTAKFESVGEIRLPIYSSAADLAPYNTKCCEKVSPLYTWVDPLP